MRKFANARICLGGVAALGEAELQEPPALQAHECHPGAPPCEVPAAGITGGIRNRDEANRYLAGSSGAGSLTHEYVEQGAAPRLDLNVLPRLNPALAAHILSPGEADLSAMRC